MSISIKPRERDAILQSLRAGVVPRVGLRHLQVGRRDEVAAVLDDLQRIEDGGASIRFIIGRYGAGKSFFLNLARTVALERQVCCGAGGCHAGTPASRVQRASSATFTLN